jgi:hypothetical protein
MRRSRISAVGWTAKCRWNAARNERAGEAGTRTPAPPRHASGAGFVPRPAPAVKENPSGPAQRGPAFLPPVGPRGEGCVTIPKVVGGRRRCPPTTLGMVNSPFAPAAAPFRRAAAGRARPLPSGRRRAGRLAPRRPDGPRWALPPCIRRRSGPGRQTNDIPAGGGRLCRFGPARLDQGEASGQRPAPPDRPCGRAAGGADAPLRPGRGRPDGARAVLPPGLAPAGRGRRGPDAPGADRDASPPGPPHGPRRPTRGGSPDLLGAAPRDAAARPAASAAAAGQGRPPAEERGRAHRRRATPLDRGAARLARLRGPAFSGGGRRRQDTIRAAFAAYLLTKHPGRPGRPTW